MIFYDKNDLLPGLKTSCFAFEVVNIARPEGHPYETLLLKNIAWHRQLLLALSNSPCQCNLVCRMVKFAEEQKSHYSGLRIVLLFYISNSDEVVLKKQIKSLKREISFVLKQARLATGTIYTFLEVKTEKHYYELTKVPLELRSFDYIRRPVFFTSTSKTNTIGYITPSKSKPQSKNFVPQYFIPEIDNINNVAARLAQSYEFTEINMHLAPVKVSVDKLLQFKEIFTKYKLNDEHFTELEKKNYREHLELLFDDNTNHYLFHVTMRCAPESLPGHSFHNNITDCFFGNLLNVEAHPASESTFLFNKEMCTHPENQLQYLYPLEIVQRSFRLPGIAADSIKWFRSESEVFSFIPNDIPKEGILLGINKALSYEVEVKISENDITKHIYIMGQTGVGKTTMLKTMINDCMNKNRGFGVVDPHGDLVNTIKNIIPEHRKNDLVMFDPTKDTGFTFNILEYNKDYPEQKTFIFNELIKVLDEMYDLRQTGGPIFELYLKNALFLIMDQGGNLDHVYKFFYNEEYCKFILENAEDKLAVEFFENAMRVRGEASFESIAPYITSKLNRFVQDAYIRKIVCADTSSIDFRKIIDSGKILLISLPKGRLGYEGVKFLGTLLFNKLIMAAFTRENIEYSARRPFYLFVDEFQNFTSREIETALSESRKYGLRLVLANQTLAQLRPEIMKILLGNVGSQVFFRPSAFDIEILSGYFKHHISEQEMLSLKNFKAFCRMMLNDEPSKPFIIETIHNSLKL